ncbi:DUF2075 domain-containing protein [Salimicrobium halophilum]|uniref:GIY-YIG domain-containing protein n=1 Tax=Salimicrobium halophilum TaxID=86666 RepID=A0A1G8UVN7_9BACI|nr:DUF2075 domain-containing protein [Salimicrobium halophilum]SDJ57789.1 hypothetical protein SAMN04490247_2425 [Salimicrobium halophilum]
MQNELIFEKRTFTDNELSKIHTIYLNNYPVVYLLLNKKKSIAYIGQTAQARRRLKTHLASPERNLHNETVLIGHNKLNQSATYNIETKLINYFIADNKYKLQNVSQTRAEKMHDYYQKDMYNNEIFNDIWEKLREEQIAEQTIEHLQNKDIYKLSPYKELSEQQLDVKEEIIDFCQKKMDQEGHHVFIVEGEAGSGKSVLLSSLFNTIQDLSKEPSSSLHNSDNYVLVNHSEMLKTYKHIAFSLPNLKKKQFVKPTSFINQMDKYEQKADITLVDEAHLLLTKEDSYNNFRYDNQLDEIIKRSNITVVIFDSKQVLKLKSYWNNQLLNEITKNYNAETFTLTDQFRMNASEDIVDWVDHFVNKRLLPVPTQKEENFELKIFEDPEVFKKAIFEKNERYGLSRIVSTFDYLHKKDGQTYYVDEDGINMPWNVTHENTTWAEEADTIHEVGSIYTVQGFDLNYVGVVLGPSVTYDPDKDSLVIKPEKYKDKGAFASRKDKTEAENEALKEKVILNSINVLMKRGMRGLYIYATEPELREKLIELYNKELK